jgi:hypothetical protein
MPEWITYRAPEDGRVTTGRAPFDARTTGALVRAARSVRRPGSKAGATARSSVYVVLLDFGARGLGLYVGRTGRTPDERYQNHKAGYKSSKWPRRYGVGLLPALYRHLNPLDTGSVDGVEVELALALRTTGVTVHQA